MSAGPQGGDLSPKMAKSLIEALDLRALRARRHAIEQAGALQEAETRVIDAARAHEAVVAAAAEARRAAEAALSGEGGARMADILAVEHQEIVARRDREAAEHVLRQAVDAQVTARRVADEAAALARSAETRVEKVRYALERELGAAERLEALRLEEAAADGEG